MTRFCANISMLYAEAPLLERIGAARRAGFDAVEVLFPYDDNAANLRAALDVHEMPLALINCPPPNYADPTGPRGFAAVPGEAARFKSAFRRAKRYADALKAERIHVMAGVADGAEAEACMIDNLRWAVSEAGDLPLTIEPINREDMPGYFLHDFDLALRILQQVGAPTLGLQFDIYHAAKISGDVLAQWDLVKTHVTHVQFADCPGRGAPGTGDLDLAGIIGRIRADGYEGWISAEFKSDGDTTTDWLKVLAAT